MDKRKENKRIIIIKKGKRRNVKKEVKTKRRNRMKTKRG